ELNRWGGRAPFDDDVTFVVAQATCSRRPFVSMGLPVGKLFPNSLRSPIIDRGAGTWRFQERGGEGKRYGGGARARHIEPEGSSHHGGVIWRWPIDGAIAGAERLQGLWNRPLSGERRGGARNRGRGSRRALR